MGISLQLVKFENTHGPFSHQNFLVGARSNTDFTVLSWLAGPFRLIAISPFVLQFGHHIWCLRRLTILL